MKAQAQTQGVPEETTVRIVGKMVNDSLQNVQAMLNALSHFESEELNGALGLLVKRVEDLESAHGATAHLHMTQGVGDVTGMDEVKGVAVEMPKHTKRRDFLAASLHLILLKMSILHNQNVLALEKQNYFKHLC